MRYPLVEALGGWLGWAVMQSVVLEMGSLHIGRASLLFLSYFALALGLLAALFIDLDHMLLPDSLTLGGIGLGVATLPIRDVDWADALLGGALGFLGVWLVFIVGYRWLRGRDGMGLGDAKLLALAGVWFGSAGALFVLLAGAVQGLVFALSVLAASGKLEEPEGMKEERREFEAHLASLSEEEQQKVKRELEGDLLLSDPNQGMGALPFGPFMILAIYELMFFGEALGELYRELLWPTRL